MIKSKEELKEYIASDNSWFVENSFKDKLVFWYGQYPGWKLKKYLKYLRMHEFYYNTATGRHYFKKFLKIFYERKKHRLGSQLGIEISPNCFEKGLTIDHAGSIIINNDAKIGENCRLHGANCIGNNGQSKEAPTLGRNVDVGYGAVIIGNVTIADDIIIGANAVVNKSFTEPGCIIAGIPAKVVKQPNKRHNKGGNENA